MAPTEFLALLSRWNLMKFPSSPRRRGSRLSSARACKVWIPAFAGMTAEKVILSQYLTTL
ncbi:hypothetical protein FZ029_17355 [Azospirillum sp. Sh1]|nr:hypothetical protein FZ029_17355 [Azospirillum sp. Sh1]